MQKQKKAKTSNCNSVAREQAKPTQAVKPNQALKPMTAKDRIKLQKEWYKKLEDSGFEDIEWFDKKTGKGQNSDYLKRPDQIKMKQYKPESEFYYSMCRNYMSHNYVFNRVHRHVYNLYTEGLPYRTIMKRVAKDLKKRYSLYFIFYHVNKFKAKVLKWNKEHPEGLLHPTQTDAFIEEVLIKEHVVSSDTESNVNESND